MDRRYILHMFTPGRQMSPFDVNMAVDAGYEVVVPYAEVGLDNVTAMTQDAIFSRGPKGTRYTGIFIGGRDVIVAADMLERAREAMVGPFAVPVFADPSGSYTTAAAMIACIERALRARGDELAGRRVLLLGGTGAVGRIAGVLAARLGAEVTLCSHSGQVRAQQAADAVNARFGTRLQAAAADSPGALRALLADAEVLCGTAAAGVQVASAQDLAAARRLRVAADVNAVPPAGIAGIDAMDDRRPLAGVGDGAVGIGALAIGNVKYQTQHRLFVQMRESARPVFLGIDEALATARAALAQP